MSTYIIILLLFLGGFTFLSVLEILRRGRITVKFSLVWFVISFILILLAIFPSFLSYFQRLIGFQTMANMVIGILITLLIFIGIVLTVIVSGQTTKITLLIQEISMLKQKMEDKD